MNLSETLLEYRKLSGLTLRQVEDTTGISNAYLSQLENGKIRKPSANVLYKLANIYGVNIETFLLAAGIIQDYQQVSNKKITADEEIAIAKFLQILRNHKK